MKKRYITPLMQTVHLTIAPLMQTSGQLQYGDDLTQEEINNNYGGEVFGD